MNNLKKKARKKKEREERIRSERVRLTMRRRYPSFLFINAEAADDFGQIVKTICRNFDFASLGPWHKEGFETIRRHGQPLVAKLKERIANVYRLMHSIGDKLFASIGEETLRKYLPFYDFDLDMNSRDIEVRFRVLSKAKGEGGTVYFSPTRPKVQVGKKEYYLGWSGHAIQQMCKRLSKNWLHYGPFGYVFSFFYEAKTQESLILPDGTPGVSIFDHSFPGLWERNYVGIIHGLRGERQMPMSNIRYIMSWKSRVGYCPLIVEGEFAKAKTLLLPGFKGTPEYGLVHRDREMPADVRQAFITMITDSELTLQDFLATDRESIVRWFTAMGIPQMRKE